MTGIAAQKSNRKAILFDLSPIASFITHNYNSSTSSDKFLTKGGEILDDVKKELSWMTQTNHTDGNKGDDNFNFI